MKSNLITCHNAIHETAVLKTEWFLISKTNFTWQLKKAKQEQVK